MGTLKGSAHAYREHKEVARVFVHRKLTELNLHYGFAYARVAIKNTRTRWGSCSKKGNLNFHFRIMELPSFLAEYIVVHELCHLKEFNHGRAFWDLVAEKIPDHVNVRRELKNFGHNKTSHSQS